MLKAKIRRSESTPPLPAGCFTKREVRLRPRKAETLHVSLDASQTVRSKSLMKRLVNIAFTLGFI